MIFDLKEIGLGPEEIEYFLVAATSNSLKKKFNQSVFRKTCEIVGDTEEDLSSFKFITEESINKLTCTCARSALEVRKGF